MSELQPRNLKVEGRRMLSISLILTKPSPYGNKITLSSVWLFLTPWTAQCSSPLELVSPMQTPDAERGGGREAIWQHHVTEEYLCVDRNSHLLV